MPLSFPSVGISNLNMRLKRSVAVSESPFSFDQQAYEHQGARWECEVTLPPLNYAEAKSVQAFIVGLKVDPARLLSAVHCTLALPLHPLPAPLYAQNRLRLQQVLEQLPQATTFS